MHHRDAECPARANAWRVMTAAIDFCARVFSHSVASLGLALLTVGAARIGDADGPLVAESGLPRRPSAGAIDARPAISVGLDVETMAKVDAVCRARKASLHSMTARAGRVELHLLSDSLSYGGVAKDLAVSGFRDVTIASTVEVPVRGAFITYSIITFQTG